MMIRFAGTATEIVDGFGLATGPVPTRVDA